MEGCTELIEGNGKLGTLFHVFYSYYITNLQDPSVVDPMAEPEYPGISLPEAIQVIFIKSLHVLTFVFIFKNI